MISVVFNFKGKFKKIRLLELFNACGRKDWPMLEVAPQTSTEMDARGGSLPGLGRKRRLLLGCWVSLGW
jgi:hypothetical protein